MSPRERQRPGARSMLTPSPEPLTQVGTTTSKAVDDAGHRGEATEELVYLSARVPKALRTELQMQGVREGRPIAQLLQDAVRAYLDSAETSR